MKVLYIDPLGGLAGDMLCAALLDSGLNVDAWEKELKKLSIPLPELSLKTVQRGPFRALYFSVENPLANDEKNADHHHHHHNHGHSHHHEHHHHDAPGASLSPVPWEENHRSWKDIQTLIQCSALDERTKTWSLAVFEKLAAAEATVHGTSIDEVHFHEVGAIDSIIDIIGFCLGCRLLGIEKILFSTIPISGGLTWSAHGQIPLPAPATLELIRGMKTRTGVENHEQITPTGAAILAALGEQAALPNLVFQSSGYGAGTRNPSQYPNIVRISIGELSAKTDPDHTPTEIIEIQSNIDDMSGEELPFLQQTLFKTGALDVSFQSLVMKKGRPAWLLTVLCPIALLEEISRCIFLHSSAFGIRYSIKQRITLDRRFETVETAYGPAHIKLGQWKDIQKESVEYEDMRRISELSNLPLRKSQELILREWRKT